MGFYGDFMGFYGDLVGFVWWFNGILWWFHGILWDLMGWIPGTGVIWVKLLAVCTGCTVGTRNGYGEDVFGGTCSDYMSPCCELKHVDPCGYPILLQRYS